MTYEQQYERAKPPKLKPRPQCQAEIQWRRDVFIGRRQCPRETAHDHSPYCMHHQTPSSRDVRRKFTEHRLSKRVPFRKRRTRYVPAMRPSGDDPMCLSKYLEWLMTAMQLTQQEWCKAARVHGNTLSDVMLGRRSLAAQYVARLAEALEEFPASGRLADEEHTLLMHYYAARKAGYVVEWPQGVGR